MVGTYTMHVVYIIIIMVLHIQHYIYMHDKNIADGVEGEEIPRDTLVFVCRLKKQLIYGLVYHHPYLG